MARLEVVDLRQEESLTNSGSYQNKELEEYSFTP